MGGAACTSVHRTIGPVHASGRAADRRMLLAPLPAAQLIGARAAAGRLNAGLVLAVALDISKRA